jgi:hypothetical protein
VFDVLSIRAGEKGVLNVLGHLGMVRKRKSSAKRIEPFIAYSSSWVRADTSGFVRD